MPLKLLGMNCVKEDKGKDTSEWAGEPERQWKQRTTEGREAKEEMEMKEELSS